MLLYAYASHPFIKVFIYLSVLTFPLIEANGQVWLQNGQTWQYTINVYGYPPSSPELNTMKVDGDTIINGKTCKIVTHSPANMLFSLNTHYTYSEDDAVYVYSSYQNDFVKIYDFTSQVGDTITLTYNDAYRIDSIGAIDIGGHTRKFQILDFFTSQTIIKRIAIEGIGVVGSPLLSFPNSCSYFFVESEFCEYSFDGRDIYFKCFHDPINSIFFDPYDECIFNSTKDSYKESITISPNPANNFLNIISNSTSLDIENISIFNLSNRIKKIDGNRKTIDIASFPNGVYFLRLQLKNGEFITEKIIIHH